MKKISISAATACLLLGLASAHAAGMGQDNMKNSVMDTKSDAMLHKAMRKAGKNDSMMHKSDAMHKDMQGSSMAKGTMQK